jgi:plasmid stabilization system protein ParE
MPVQSWIVFFRVIDDDRVVRVLRVRHGARRRLKRYE